MLDSLLFSFLIACFSVNFGKTLPTSAVQADSRMAKRRKMVADCKGMRAQIFEFEQDWTRKHNRIPKTYERGAMQSVYAKYRELKKDIRNLAAVDLQRTARGFIARCRLRGPSHSRARPSWAVNHSAVHSGTGGTAAAHSTAATTGGKAAVHKSVDDLITATNSSHHQPLSHFAESHKAAAASLQHQHQHQPQLHIGSGGSTSSHPEGTPLGDLYGRYRELLNNKRELKRKLKKFDEDFVEQWGRLPKKADKEVIRPMYQKYHEVKSSLDELKSQIEQSHGPLPDDLLEDGKHGGSTGSLTSGGGKTSDADGDSEVMDGKQTRSKSVNNAYCLTQWEAVSLRVTATVPSICRVMTMTTNRSVLTDKPDMTRSNSSSIRITTSLRAPSTPLEGSYPFRNH